MRVLLAYFALSLVTPALAQEEGSASTPAMRLCGQSNYDMRSPLHDWLFKCSSEMQRRLNQSGEKIEGPTTCSFRLSQNAQILNLQVKESSGSKSKDGAAVAALQKYGSFESPPEEFTRTTEIVCEISNNRVTFSASGHR